MTTSTPKPYRPPLPLEFVGLTPANPGTMALVAYARDQKFDKPKLEDYVAEFPVVAWKIRTRGNEADCTAVFPNVAKPENVLGYALAIPNGRYLYEGELMTRAEAMRELIQLADFHLRA